MTMLDIIMENSAWATLFALYLLAALFILFNADSLGDDWFMGGFVFDISPMTALVGCCGLVLLFIFSGGEVTFGGAGNQSFD